MGNSGSGKSTSVCYLLGHKLKTDKNKAGDTIVQLQNKWDESKPRIGQGLAESETLYVEAYKLLDPPNDGVIFCDCPGFGDTRGKEAELILP